MYRDDREALTHRVESLSREADSLRAENQAIRAAVQGQPPQMDQLAMMGGAFYQVDVRALPLAARARLAGHQLTRFPVWAVGVLNIVTLGLFPLIHFGLMHDKMPRAAHNDPSAGKAIGFQFIPYFNLYWVFFSAIRLADRLSLQLRLRGLPDRAPRGLLIAACIFTVIPYLNVLIGIPIMWTIAVCYLQATVNKIAALPPDSWDATPLDANGPAVPFAPNLSSPLPMTPEQQQQADRARKLVTWSHVLGWGGLGMLLAGSAAGGIIAGAPGAVSVALIAIVLMIAGGILGQIGRGMQGRAI